LIQLQSGGVGLNLQHFQSIVFSGPWWTAALMEQAVGRAVRIGQKSQVVVHHIVLKEEQGLNIDKHMRTKAEAKGKMCYEALAAADHTLA
jgi:SNF2 family DNA or RNA helicase